MENSAQDVGRHGSDSLLPQERDGPSKSRDDTDYIDEDYTIEPILLIQIISFSNAVHQFDFDHGFHREERRDGFSFYATSLFLNVLWMSIYFIGTKLQGTCARSWLVLNSPLILILFIFDVVLYIYAFRLAWVIKLKAKNRVNNAILLNPLRAAQSAMTVKFISYKLFQTVLRITVQFLSFIIALDFPKYRLFTLVPFNFVNFRYSAQSRVSQRQIRLKQFLKRNFNAILRSIVFASIIIPNFMFLGTLPLYFYWFRRFAKLFKNKFRNVDDLGDDAEDDDVDQMEYGDGVVNFCFFIIMLGIHVKHLSEFMGFSIVSYHMAFTPVHFIMAVINTGFAGLLD
jgi:hypothetical protein